MTRPTITPARVRERVARIDRHAGDDEGAHADEDKLHRDVLHAIARGADDPAALATEAIKTEKISFRRWYA